MPILIISLNSSILPIPNLPIFTYSTLSPNKIINIYFRPYSICIYNVQLYVFLKFTVVMYLPLESHVSFPAQARYQNLFLAISCKPLLQQPCSLCLCIFLLLLKHLYLAFPQIVKECSLPSWHHHKERAKH